MPADANVHGDVFGGWIMSHVDVAGAIPAARRASGRVATVAVTSFVFRQAVFVRDLVSFYAEITKVGTTSITVDVEVSSTQSSAEEVVKVTRQRWCTWLPTNSASLKCCQCYESRGDAAPRLSSDRRRSGIAGDVAADDGRQ